MKLETRDFKISDDHIITVPTEDIEMIFKGFRPRDMDNDTFRYIRAILKYELKDHLRGQIIHVAKVTDNVWENYTKELGRKVKQKGYTYVKKDQTSSGYTVTE